DGKAARCGPRLGQVRSRIGTTAKKSMSSCYDILLDLSVCAAHRHTLSLSECVCVCVCVCVCECVRVCVCVSCPCGRRGTREKEGERDIYNVYGRGGGISV